MSEIKHIGRESVDTSQAVAELVKRSVALRRELMEAGARADADGYDTAEGLKRCFEEGLDALSVPVAYGGLSDGSPGFAAEAFLEIVTNLAASDASLGQNWFTTQLAAREIFEHDKLPEATRREIGDMIVNRGVRFVASNAETGSPRPVTARDVPGGIRVSGVKTFNSNSGGGGYAYVGFRREGADGVYHAFIPLDAEGVQPHNDWDNMGQRGTCSQTITYNDVFVPDGWHYAMPLHPVVVGLALTLHGTLVLGSGFGALDAGLDHLRGANRVMLKRFKTTVEDPLMMRRIGVLSSRLNGALAYQRQVARAAEAASTADELKAFTIDACRAKTVSVEAGLEAASNLFDLTGARTTARKYHFDRFWRNARTFSVHSPVDMLYASIGAWDLHRQEPDLFGQYGVKPPEKSGPSS